MPWICDNYFYFYNSDDLLSIDEEMQVSAHDNQSLLQKECINFLENINHFLND